MSSRTHVLPFLNLPGIWSFIDVYCLLVILVTCLGHCSKALRLKETFPHS
jgi:hypothetical protein